MKKDKIYLEIGDCIIMEMPYSEVCMHMKVAGTTMVVERLSHSAQLYQLGNCSECGAGLENNVPTHTENCSQKAKPTKGQPFSFPITLGEAGLYYEIEGNQVRIYGYGEKLEKTPEDISEAMKRRDPLAYKCPNCGHEERNADNRQCMKCGREGDWIQPEKE